MRLLVLLLLLLNLLTFAWIQWGQPTPQPAPSELNPDKIHIVKDTTETVESQSEAAPDSTTAVAEVTPSVTVPETSTPAKPATESKPAICIEWGPIAINRVGDAEIRLNRLKLGERISAEDASIRGGPYWVYYPALKTKDDADNKAIELQAKGVKDISVVRDGKWENAISMGLYSKEAIANVRVENLKKLGVTAQIDARGKAARLFTLRGLSADEMDKVKKLQAEFGGPALKKTACKIP